jgi:hypothetical protein
MWRETSEDYFRVVWTVSHILPALFISPGVLLLYLTYSVHHSRRPLVLRLRGIEIMFSLCPSLHISNRST